jgi:hypothetical protein
MPNRILKESICDSEEIDSLSDKAEIFFYRLIVNCDDYGRLDARPAILKAKCFPLKEPTIYTDLEILNWLSELSAKKLIRVYTTNNFPYIEVITWAKHQQIRAKRSKYPAFDGSCYLLQANEISVISNRMISDDNICPRNPIQSNPIQSESNPSEIKDNENEDNHKRDAFKIYNEEYHKITASITNRLNDLIKEYSEEKVVKGLEEGIKHEHRNLAYVEKILENNRSGVIKNNKQEIISSDSGKFEKDKYGKFFQR